MWKTIGTVIGWVLSVLYGALAAFMIVRLAESHPSDDISIHLIILFPSVAAAILLNPLVFSRIPIIKNFFLKLVFIGILGVGAVVAGYYADSLTPNGMAYSAQQYHDGKNGPVNLLKAAELYQRAADKGNVTAQVNLGLMYRLGEGVNKDQVKATSLFQKASDQNDGLGTVHLAEQYDLGWGTSKNPAKAAELYQRALDEGIGDEKQESVAENNLGNLYLHGEGVAQDYGKALNYYQSAAAKGNDSAIYNVGFIYYQGFGVPQDYNKAAEYYQKASDLGNVNALVNLGSMYYNGYGVRKDQAKALELTQKAADLGNDVAKENLKIMANP